jgi:hypothetical protein
MFSFALGAAARALITEPPCFPVAPVTRTVFNIMKVLEKKWKGEWCRKIGSGIDRCEVLQPFILQVLFTADFTPVEASLEP